MAENRKNKLHTIFHVNVHLYSINSAICLFFSFQLLSLQKEFVNAKLVRKKRKQAAFQLYFIQQT